MPTTVPIEQFAARDVPPGRRARCWLEIGSGLLDAPRIPALVARGEREGRLLLAVAGVHGDEYEGMEAIRLVFDELDPKQMAGTFVGVPVANPYAYEARARVAPRHVDGLNLARVFPGDPEGSPSRLLAHHLLGLVLSHVGPDDLFLDCHSGSADVAYATLIGVRDVPGSATERAEEAARHFGLANLWRIPDSPGPFNAETARRGIPTLGTETTGRAGCRPHDVAALARGLRGLLAYLGILPWTERLRRFDGPARATVDLLAPTTGFLRSFHQLEDEVEAGERLATIVSPFGDPLGEIVAPVAGTIWAARAMPPVRGGELCYMIATTAGR